MKPRKPKSPPAPSKPLKAYTASDYDREQACVVFGHRNSMALRREAAGEIGDGDPSGITLRRAPEFDIFADGRPITTKDKLERGWWQTCSGCSISVDSENSHYEGHKDLEDGEEVPETFFNDAQPDSVWCSWDCYRDELTEKYQRAVTESEMKRSIVSELLTRYPGVRIHPKPYAYADLSDPERSEARVSFGFPGSATSYSGEMNHKRRMTVAKADVNAWYLYTQSLFNAQDRDTGDEAE